MVRVDLVGFRKRLGCRIWCWWQGSVKIYRVLNVKPSNDREWGKKRIP